MSRDGPPWPNPCSPRDERLFAAERVAWAATRLIHDWTLWASINAAVAAAETGPSATTARADALRDLAAGRCEPAAALVAMQALEAAVTTWQSQAPPTPVHSHDAPGSPPP